MYEYDTHRLILIFGNNLVNRFYIIYLFCGDQKFLIASLPLPKEVMFSPQSIFVLVWTLPQTLVEGFSLFFFIKKFKKFYMDIRLSREKNEICPN